MLQRIGGRDAGDRSDNRVVRGLLECHERIRRFTGYAARLGEEAAFEDDQVRDAAQAVVRYFSVALPLHSADEDESIAPRLAGAPDEVQVALASMTAQHVDIHRVIDELLPLWEAVAAEPSRRAELRDRLAAGAVRLGMMFTEHLGLEERVVLPAIEALAPEVVARIGDEMTARRRPEGA